jgi:hypothetical protein
LDLAFDVQRRERAGLIATIDSPKGPIDLS